MSEQADALRVWEMYREAESQRLALAARLSEVEEALREIADGDAYGSVHLQEIARAALAAARTEGKP